MISVKASRFGVLVGEEEAERAGDGEADLGDLGFAVVLR